MVDKPDPGEQYGGAGTGARIREALKNVADLLSRTQADEEENLRLGMQSYIRQNAPPPTYETPNMLMRGAEAAAKYTVMGAEEGFKPATEAVKKVVKAGVNNTATSLKDAYTNIAARPNLLLDTVGGIGRPSYMTGQATPANIEGLTPNYLPNMLDREFNKAEITLKNAANVGAKELNKFVSNVTYEAKNPPTGFYAPALATPTTTSMPAKPKQTQSEAFVAQSNFDTSDPEVNAYKNSGPREYGRIDYISYAADLLGNSETPYPDVAYAVASSETNRGRTTQIKGQIPLNPDGSYKDGAHGPWQFVPKTAMHPDINLLRKDPQTGKWIDDRGDPIKSARAFVILTNMNRENFINNFKREPTKTELYLGHLLGSGDLKKSLQNEATEPTKLAKTILPKRVIEKNLRVPDEQKAALAEKISIKDFLDMHRNAFNTYIKEYPSWRAARQGKELDIGVNQYRVGGLVGPGGVRVDPGSDPTTPAGQRKSRSQQPTRAGVLKSLMPTAEENPEDKIRSAIQNAAENVGRFITQSRDSGALGGALSQVAQWPVTAVTNPLLAANQAQQMLDPAYNVSKGMAETKLSAEQRDLPGVITGLTQTAGGALGLIPGAGLLPKRPPVYSPAAGQRAMARTVTSPTTQAFENPTPFAGVQGELFPNQKLGPITDYDTELDTDFSKQDFKNSAPFAGAQGELFPNEKLGPVTNKSLLDWLQPYGFEDPYLNSSEAELVGEVSDALRRSGMDSLERQQTIFTANNPQISKPFKSKLEETILKLNPQTVKPLTKAGWEKVLTDVRKQELEESGLTEFLKSKGNEKIYLDEIEDYLFNKQNLISVIETTREPLDSFDFKYAIENIDSERERLRHLRHRLHDIEFYTDMDVSGQVFAALDSAVLEKEQAINAYDDAINLLNVNKNFEEYTLAGGSNYRNILLSWHSPSRGNVPAGEHFPDVPNTFVHMRLKDRFIDTINDESGNPIQLNKRRKALSVEEVQSDLHQRGRQYGYKTYDPSKPVEEQVPQDDDAYLQRPAFDAPFKDNAWLKIAIKRLLVEALDNGYDYISWIPGNTHNGSVIHPFEIKPGQRPELFYDKVFREVAESISGGKTTKLDPDSFNTFSKPIAKDDYHNTVDPVSMNAIYIKDPKVLDRIKKLKESGMYQYAVPAAVGTGAAATTMGGQDKEFRVGGLVGPGGMRMRPYNEQPPAGEPMRFGYTPPVDRPILPAERPMPQYQEPPMPQRPGAPGLTPPRFDFMERRFPSYQEGGMIGPGGMPVRPAGVAPQQAPTMASDQLESEIQRMMQQNPQAVQQIQQEIMSAMQTGELTPQELNMMVQLATLAAQNPQMYPQIRQFAIQQGIASEEDLGQEYDQGLVFTILLAARASQQQAQGGASPAMGQAPQVPQAAMQPPVASMMSGGALPQKSQNADGSVPIIAHEGEYVIPKEIVLQKGTDFFDKLIGKGPNASGNVR